MKKQISLQIICIIILLLSYTHSIAQGCSDAGICTINSAKPHHNTEDVFKNRIKVGVAAGLADYDILVLSSYVEYNRSLTQKLSADIRINGLMQNGNSVSTSGLSDLYLTLNYKLFPKIGLTGGIKIPMNKADRAQDGQPLPMDYQSSLGTKDLLFGISGQIQRLQLVLAFQQPITQNDNNFISSDYPMSSIFNTIQSTNEFIRSSDLVARISYPFQLSEKFSITPGILPIYHLFEDKYTDKNMIQQSIKGSDGLTLNLNAFADYIISKKSAIQFNIGFPVINRESRPDGLTRSFIGTFEYQYKF